MTTTRATKKAASPARKPTKSGDPRADRAAATKKAETVTARAAKAATPKAKPVTKKAATPKVTPSNGLKAALIKKGWTVALTRNQAIAAYCKQRTLLHGAGPEAYRKATAKALGITDEAFLAAFYAPKAKPEGK